MRRFFKASEAIRTGISACLCMACVLVGMSCRQSLLPEETPLSDKKVTLTISLGDDASELTKSMISLSDENMIREIDILSYNGLGDLVERIKLSEGELSARLSLLTSEEYRIYVLANCYLPGEPADYADESNIIDFTYSIDSYAELSSKGFPMATSFRLILSKEGVVFLRNPTGESNKLSGRTLNIKLRKLVCRYLMRLDRSSSQENGCSYSVSSLKLSNAARKLQPFFPGGSRAESSDEVIDGDMALSVDLAAFNRGEPVCFYCLENCQEELSSPFATRVSAEAEIFIPSEHRTVSGVYSAALGAKVGQDCCLRGGKEYYLTIEAGSDDDSPFSCHYFSYVYNPSKYCALNGYLYCDDAYEVSGSNCNVFWYDDNSRRVVPHTPGEYELNFSDEGYEHSVCFSCDYALMKFEQNEYPLLLDGSPGTIQATMCDDDGIYLYDFDEGTFNNVYGELLLKVAYSDQRFVVDHEEGIRSGFRWKWSARINSYTDSRGITAITPFQISGQLQASFSEAVDIPSEFCRVRAKALFEGLSIPIYNIDFTDTYLPPTGFSHYAIMPFDEPINLDVDTYVSSFSPHFRSDVATYYHNGTGFRIPYFDHSMGCYPIYADFHPENDDGSIMSLLVGYVNFRRHLVYGGLVDDIENATWVTYEIVGDCDDYIDGYELSEILRAPDDYGGIDFYFEELDDEYFNSYGYDRMMFQETYPFRIGIFDPYTGEEFDTEGTEGWHDPDGEFLPVNVYLHRISDSGIAEFIPGSFSGTMNGWINNN